ncbi:unnamed protein product, partial [Prorocentrum cordatum]
VSLRSTGLPMADVGEVLPVVTADRDPFAMHHEYMEFTFAHRNETNMQDEDPHPA